MRVRLRLSQLLKRHHQSGHGLIARLTNATGIERHKMGHLLEDKEDKISLLHLGELCRYLIEHCNVDPRELPGALFELEPSRFLALLRNAPELRTCFGVRQRGEARPDAPWAAGTDSFLHGKLLELLLCPEPLPERDRQMDDDVEYVPPRERGRLTSSWPLQIRQFHQEQVHAASAARLEGSAEERAQELQLIKQDADRVYRILHHDPQTGQAPDEPQQAIGQVVLLLGTLKSNPACELAIARTFAAEPWGEHGRTARDAEANSAVDLVQTPRERAVPFFIRYRDKSNSGLIDPRIPSCCAGERISRDKVSCGKNAHMPGIYYETGSGKWECSPWNEVDRDAALLVLDFDRQQGKVEVVIGGFSSRATLLLADNLEKISRFLLPEPLDSEQPQEIAYITPERAVAAFVIEFHIHATETVGVGGARLPKLVQRPKVISVAREVLARRLDARH